MRERWNSFDENCARWLLPAAPTQAGLARILRANAGWTTRCQLGEKPLISPVSSHCQVIRIAASLGTLAPGSTDGGAARPELSWEFESARPGVLETLSRQVSDAVYCQLSILASTAYSLHIYTARSSPARHPPSTRCSVAASTALGRPKLVHLGDTFFELDVLALFVAVSLVLRQAMSVDRVPLRNPFRGFRPPPGPARHNSYLALPRQIVRLKATAVEGNQQVGAAVSILKGELRSAHLLAGRSCGRLSAHCVPENRPGRGEHTPRCLA